MIRLAVKGEDRFGLAVLDIGRSELVDGSCVLEMAGRHLFYCVAVDAGRIQLLVSPLDSGGDLERLVSFDDEAEGWDTVGRLLHRLEQDGIRSLERPIELGPPDGRGSWLIA